MLRFHILLLITFFFFVSQVFADPLEDLLKSKEIHNLNQHGERSKNYANFSGDYRKLLENQISIKDCLGWLISYFDNFNEKKIIEESNENLFFAKMPLEPRDLLDGQLEVYVPFPHAIAWGSMGVLETAEELVPSASSIVLKQDLEISSRDAKLYQIEPSACWLSISGPRSSKIVIRQEPCHNPFALTDFAEKLNVARLVRRLSQ